MPSLNATARNTAVTAVTDTYAAGTLQLLVGETVVATHSFTGWGTPSAGVRLANAIANVTVGSGGGTVTSAKMVAGANEATLSVGTSGSGAEVIMSTTTLVDGGSSQINSVTVTMPASG